MTSGGEKMIQQDVAHATILTILLLTAGCIDTSSRDPAERVGPLKMEFHPIGLSDPRNFTFSLAFHNTGNENVSIIDNAQITSHAFSPDGNDSAGTLSSRAALPRTVSPHYWENVTIQAFFDSDRTGLFQSYNASEIVYQSSITIDYVIGEQEYAWTYYSPCFDRTLQHTTAGIHDCTEDWLIFREGQTPS
jgi:hypothetical protein